MPAQTVPLVRSWVKLPRTSVFAHAPFAQFYLVFLFSHRAVFSPSFP
jgi:hypothetical protein